MAQVQSNNNYPIQNDTGANVLADINENLAALNTNNSGTAVPINRLAHQFYVDTNNTPAELKISNASNNDYVVLGKLETDLGHLSKLGGTLTGNLQLPNGTSSAPSLNVGESSGTGLYRSAVNTLAFASGGDLKMFISNTVIQLVGTDTAGAKLRFREKNGQQNNYVQFKCPSNLASNVTLTLPTSLQGTHTAGLRVLKTNSSGSLSFQFVDASDLAGTTLPDDVKNSNLESVGTLGSLNVTGTCTAGTFSGSGANLTSLPAAQLTGTIPDARFPSQLPAIDGSNLTGISAVPKCSSIQLNSTFTNSDNNPLPREEFQTALTLNHTPSSSSVKLLVMITGRILKSGTGSASDNSNAVFQCFEGTTAIGTEVIHGNSSEVGSMSIDQNILRTPNSENTITYNLKIKSSDDDKNVKMLAGATLTILEVS